MTSPGTIDRYPLISQKGNFSGKASALIKSFIRGDWFRSSPTTGDVPEYVEKNVQFHLNQGPVDMSVYNARPTETPSSLIMGHGYTPKTPDADLSWLYEEGIGKMGGW